MAEYTEDERRKRLLDQFKEPDSLREFLYNFRRQHEHMIGISAYTLVMTLDAINKYVDDNAEIDMPSHGLCVYVGPDVEWCEICQGPGMRHKHTNEKSR